jgi:hypothetical protein
VRIAKFPALADVDGGFWWRTSIGAGEEGRGEYDIEM